MDQKKQQNYQGLVEQAAKFQSLASHHEWGYFRGWVEKLRSDYERSLKHPGNIESHIALAQAQEGYNAINNLLDNFDNVIASGIDARKKLNEGTDGTKEPVTGRRLN